MVAVAAGETNLRSPKKRGKPKMVTQRGDTP
jgi:hypothetical protein